MKLSYSNIGFAQEDDEKVYELLAQLGYAGLEIAPSRIIPENPYDALPIAEQFAKDIKQKYNFGICSMQSIWYKRPENIFGGSTAKNALLNYTYKAIDFAQAIGCKNLVFGCPKNRNMPKGADKSEFEGFLQRLTGYAKRHECVVGLEANPTIYGTNIINTTNEAANLVEKIADPALQINLDFGTIIQNEESLVYIPEFVHLISHVHISEPGLAKIQTRKEHEKLAQILADGKYDGYISVETACQDYDTVAEQAKYLKEVFG